MAYSGDDNLKQPFQDEYYQCFKDLPSKIFQVAADRKKVLDHKLRRMDYELALIDADIKHEFSEEKDTVDEIKVAELEEKMLKMHDKKLQLIEEHNNQILKIDLIKFQMQEIKDARDDRNAETKRRADLKEEEEKQRNRRNGRYTPYGKNPRVSSIKEEQQEAVNEFNVSTKRRIQ